MKRFDIPLSFVELIGFRRLRKILNLILVINTALQPDITKVKCLSEILVRSAETFELQKGDPNPFAVDEDSDYEVQEAAKI
jgi:hypothetical protein